MRPVSVSVIGAAGNSAWIPVNALGISPTLSLAASLTEDANGITYSVQHTYQDFGPDALVPVAIARVGTVATVTFNNPHGLVTGDSLIVQGSGSAVLDSQVDAGGRPIGWDVTATSPVALTYTVANSGPVAALPSAQAMGHRVFSVTALTTQTTRQFANLPFAVAAVRLKVTLWTAGGAILDVLYPMGR